MRELSHLQFAVRNGYFWFLSNCSNYFRKHGTRRQTNLYKYGVVPARPSLCENHENPCWSGPQKCQQRTLFEYFRSFLRHDFLLNVRDWCALGSSLARSRYRAEDHRRCLPSGKPHLNPTCWRSRSSNDSLDHITAPLLWLRFLSVFFNCQGDGTFVRFSAWRRNSSAPWG